jgi:hypothetical protein
METATNTFPYDPAKAGLPKVVARGKDVGQELRMVVSKLACPPQLVGRDVDLEKQRSTRVGVTCGKVERTLSPQLWFRMNIGGDAGDCGFGKHEVMDVCNNLR